MSQHYLLCSTIPKDYNVQKGKCYFLWGEILYVSIYQYKRCSLDSLFNFPIKTSQNKFIELSSYRSNDVSSEYYYDNMLTKLIESSNDSYPIKLYVELYQEIDEELLNNKINFMVLCESYEKKLYCLNICNREELKSSLKFFYQSGMDSLFNTITKSDQKVHITIKNQIVLFADQDLEIPCFSFTHDLQGLILFGQEKWTSEDFVKKELLGDSLVIDEVDIL